MLHKFRDKLLLIERHRRHYWRFPNNKEEPMKAKWLISLMCAFVLALGCSIAWAVDPPQFPQNATFSTLVTTEFSVEGLTADTTRNLYTAGRVVTNGQNCPVYRVNPVSGANSLVTVGFIPDPDASASGPLCSPTGLAFNSAGALFIADGGAARVYSLVPNAAAPPTATTPFASGVPGANGIAFDRDGNLFVSDGTTGQGRVWKVSGSGANCAPPTPVNCEEVFRIQPMANEVNLVGGVGGVGRDVRTLPPGLITVTPTARNAALNTVGCPPPAPPCVLGSQPLVANGLAFNHQGDLFVADTARGAIWKVEFDRHGNLTSEIGCDTTFTSNTLCLNNIFIAHPILEGVDGIALDRAGNIWASVNERNAIAVVSKDGRVAEVFRNPVNNNNLRNAATNADDNDTILEFPTSPFLLGKIFCTANSDGNRRDNSPATSTVFGVNVGELGGVGQPLGKISCMDQELKIQGLPLPID
jgi:sugar lactone lactonase YvrE